MDVIVSRVGTPNEDVIVPNEEGHRLIPSCQTYLCSSSEHIIVAFGMRLYCRSSDQSMNLKDTRIFNKPISGICLSSSGRFVAVLVDWSYIDIYDVHKLSASAVTKITNVSGVRVNKSTQISWSCKTGQVERLSVMIQVKSLSTLVAVFTFPSPPDTRLVGNPFETVLAEFPLGFECLAWSNSTDRKLLLASFSSLIVCDFDVRGGACEFAKYNIMPGANIDLI